MIPNEIDSCSPRATLSETLSAVRDTSPYTGRDSHRSLNYVMTMTYLMLLLLRARLLQWISWPLVPNSSVTHAFSVDKHKATAKPRDSVDWKPAEEACCRPRSGPDLYQAIRARPQGTSFRRTRRVIDVAVPKLICILTRPRVTSTRQRCCRRVPAPPPNLQTCGAQVVQMPNTTLVA